MSQERTARTLQTRLLTDWQRRVGGLVGVAALAAGGMAVFRTDNEAGSVALVTVGGFFLALAGLGIVPERVKAGDNEVDLMTKTVEGVSRTMDEAPPLEREDLGRRALSRSYDPPVNDAILKMLQAETSFLTALREALPDDVKLLENERWGSSFDAIAENSVGLRLGIEYKSYDEPITMPDAGNIIRQLAPAGTQGEVHNALLVCHTEPSADAGDFLSRHKVEYVLWNKADPPLVLHNAIRNAFGR